MKECSLYKHFGINSFHIIKFFLNLLRFYSQKIFHRPLNVFFLPDKCRIMFSLSIIRNRALSKLWTTSELFRSPASDSKLRRHTFSLTNFYWQWKDTLANDTNNKQPLFYEFMARTFPLYFRFAIFVVLGVNSWPGHVLLHNMGPFLFQYVLK